MDRLHVRALHSTMGQVKLERPCAVHFFNSSCDMALKPLTTHPCQGLLDLVAQFNGLIAQGAQPPGRQSLKNPTYVIVHHAPALGGESAAELC